MNILYFKKAFLIVAIAVIAQFFSDVNANPLSKAKKEIDLQGQSVISSVFSENAIA